MKKKLIFTSLLFFVFIISGTQSLGQQTVDLPKDVLEQKGYYIRAGIAPAFGYSDFENSFQFDANGFFFNFRGGYRLSKKIGAHAIFSWMLAEGKTDDSFTTVDNFNLTGFGGGFTFYFGKGYSYIIPEIMLSNINTTIYDVEWDSNPGLGVNLYGGHDINFGKNMGLGLMAFVYYSTVDLVLSGPDDLQGVINVYYGVEISLRFGK